MRNNKPWESEPDEISWTDEITGLPCLIYRHPEMLHLCGYVQVPDNHRLHDSSDYSESPYEITFNGVHEGVEGVWVGFDCAHYGDLVPGALLFSPNSSSQYRDIACVKQRTTELAKWVADSQVEFERKKTEREKHILQSIEEYGPDILLSADQLDDRYNQDGDGEHPVHVKDDWKRQVSNDDTLSGYWEWVKTEIRS